VAPARAVVVSEEPAFLWDKRSRQLDYGDHVCFLCRPFRAKPGPQAWLALIDRLVHLRQEHGIGLAVLDPLAEFLPGHDENNAGLMLEALLPLRRLTDRGVAVLLLHHPRRRDGAARGSGALLGNPDILVELRPYRRAADSDRRRRLLARSRCDETPRQLVIAWTADGTDYVAPGDFTAEEFGVRWQVLQGVLEEAEGKLTRADIRAQWPPDHAAPNDGTLCRWLQQAVERGLVCRDGTGRRSAPYRYWLRGQEELWQNPMALVERRQLEALRRLEELIGQPPPPR
jgi:AAA domain